MLQKGVKSVRQKSAEEALAALQRMCARAERSSGDARRLMHRWGVSSADAEKVLQRLIADKFIDDRRFAAAFVREKMKLSSWGGWKIISALRDKGMSSEIIVEAMSVLDTCDIAERLDLIIAKKLRTLRAKDSREARNKLMRYALSLGFDFDSVTKAIERAVKVEDVDTDF